MAKIYVSLIEKKAICPKTGKPYTVKDVPENLQAEVKRLLKG